MVRLLAVLALLWSAPGYAADEDDPKLARELQTVRAPRKRYFGLAVEFGSPDILGVSAIGRPLRWLRLNLGLGTNSANVGVHGGITFVPINYKVSPSFTVEGGRMFSGGSTVITSLLSPKNYTVDQIGYDYANLHAGLEAGAPNRWLVYLHAGASYLNMDIHGHKTSQPTNGDGPITISDSSARIWTVSGKLGVVVYL